MHRRRTFTDDSNKTKVMNHRRHHRRNKTIEGEIPSLHRALFDGEDDANQATGAERSSSTKSEEKSLTRNVRKFAGSFFNRRSVTDTELLPPELPRLVGCSLEKTPDDKAARDMQDGTEVKTSKQRSVKSSKTGTDSLRGSLHRDEGRLSEEEEAQSSSAVPEPIRLRSFDTPRLMNSFRLKSLHEQSRYQMHWFIGMLFAWLRHWFEGCKSILNAMPRVFWPVLVLLAMFMPVFSILVLPVSVLVYTNGKRVIKGIVVSVPTPKQAIEKVKQWMEYIKERWHRFVSGANRRWTIILAAMAIDYWKKPPPKSAKRR